MHEMRFLHKRDFSVLECQDNSDLLPGRRLQACDNHPFNYSHLSPLPRTPNCNSSLISPPLADSDTSLMPPPVANHLPGTLHPLTLKQLLQAPLAPLPPKELSGAGGEEEEQDPMPHTSSKNNFKYVPVDPKCLTMLADMKVQKFCEYINALSGFATFPDCMKQPFSASTINNEGDVNAYLESQVVIPTWEAVIRMFPPSHRDYDLLNRRQFSIEV